MCWGNQFAELPTAFGHPGSKKVGVPSPVIFVERGKPKNDVKWVLDGFDKN